MENWNSCRGIGVLVSLTVICFIFAVSISVETDNVECGTRDGQQCSKNVQLCSEDKECLCPGNEYEQDTWTCEARKKSGYRAVGVVLFYVFKRLFWVFLFASIVSLGCYCRSAMKNRETEITQASPSSGRRECEIMPQVVTEVL